MKKSTGELNGFIAKGTTLKGELTFQDTFRIEGQFSGQIHSQNNLVIGEGGEVEGEVSVGDGHIIGKFTGKLQAARKPHISPTGKVYGDVVTGRLVMEEGAILHGNTSMDQGDARPAAKPTFKRVEGGQE